jgi:hypothetical protein
LLYFHREKLVILCQPKTGTTALHEAISGDASIAFRTPPHMKHMTYGKFMRVLAPWLATSGFKRKNVTFVSVMREPIDWFASWYKYNSRSQLASPNSKGYARYTGDITFDEYLEALLLPQKEAPEYAKLGGPCSVAMNNSGQIGVDLLYPYTAMDELVAFLSDKLDRRIELGKANTSVSRDTNASPQMVAKTRAARKFEFDLYDTLRPDGTVPEQFRHRET